MLKIRYPKKHKKRLSKQIGFKLIFANPTRAESLLSPHRVKSFGGIRSYQIHLDFIQKIIPLIQNIEVILRNKIDKILSTRSQTWLLDLYFLNLAFLNLDYQSFPEKKQKFYQECQSLIYKALKQICKQEKFYLKESPDLNELLKIPKLHFRLLSKMSMGFWIKILLNNDFKDLDLHSKIFPQIFASIKQDKNYFLHFLDTSSFAMINRNRPNHREKVLILISFLSSIRNRALHWENLLKYNFFENKKYSSLSTDFWCSHKNKTISISLKATKENILEFLQRILEDLIRPR